MCTATYCDVALLCIFVYPPHHLCVRQGAGKEHPASAYDARYTMYIAIEPCAPVPIASWTPDPPPQKKKKKKHTPHLPLSVPPIPYPTTPLPLDARVGIEEGKKEQASVLSHAVYLERAAHATRKERSCRSSGAIAARIGNVRHSTYILEGRDFVR